MKRCWGDDAGDAELSLSLSCGSSKPAKVRSRRTKAVDDGVFECKTCSRRFTTFQALGGHRTSHMRRPRASEQRRNVHRCSICGMGFPLGQALGGHMRRHKAMAGEDLKQISDQKKKKKLDFDMAPLEFNLFDVVRRGSSHSQLLQLFV